MNENLSRIVAELVKSKGGEDLSARINRLRDEIKKAIEGEDTLFGKIRGLVESFREIIPDEKQRYHAALKALSTTSKLSREEIVKAVNNQLEELKILEKGLMSGIPGWRDEFKVMQAALQEMRDEIANLREKLARLESEEKVILNAMAAREQEMGVVEKAVKELFTDIGADITAAKIKIEEVTVESAVVQPVPPVEPVVARPVPPVEHAATQPIQPVEHAPAPVPPRDSLKSDIPSATAAGVEQKSEIQESVAPLDSEWQKKCPMCGGRMDFHIDVKIWMCYTCAYEEPGTGEVPGKSEVKLEQRNAPEPTPHGNSPKSDIPGATMVGVEQKSEIQEAAPPLDSEWQKKCPMCGGRMDLQMNGEMWICYTCAFEEPGKGGVHGKSEAKREQRRAPEPAPSPSLPPTKTKPCPACGKKMQFYPDENAWRCPHCDYERRI